MLLTQDNFHEKIENYSGALPESFIIPDHLGGFDLDLRNPVLDQLSRLAERYQQKVSVTISYAINHDIQTRYPNLDFRLWFFPAFRSWEKYTTHPDLSFKNFICSFNGSRHVSRKLLVAMLHRMGWFNPDTCSKNFIFTADILDDHIQHYVDDRSRFYRKFFITDNSDDFFRETHGFGHLRFDHEQNIHNLEHKITSCFVQIVSESLATSNYPCISEKFLYSVVTRGLFLAYAPPGWHQILEKVYGFKKYDKIFDYRFDHVQNPVERLVEMMSMLSKFSALGSDDWRDLHGLELDTIERNYDHYFSGDYLKYLSSHATIHTT